MMDEHRNINQSNLHNNMSTKDPIKAAVEEVWNLLLLGNFWKIAIMMCDSDLQGDKSKFKVIFWIHLMCNDINI